MVGKVLDRLPLFRTIGQLERTYLDRAMKKSLSGYLGGLPLGGYWVERLSAQWAQTFNCEAAIPCNSATSGLLAACMAADIRPGDEVWVTAYSMSATAACAKLLGANLIFCDIDVDDFTLIGQPNTPVTPKAIIVTNLFGCAARLHQLREYCDSIGCLLIEDNAQAPFATEYGIYTGTIGHIGVFSLNVHKHIQCGEGGVIVTNDKDIAYKLRNCINHGELVGDGVGLNLRMTEPIAGIACAQLEKAPDIIKGRVDLALAISKIWEEVPDVNIPFSREDCDHVYYMWAGQYLRGKVKRDLLMKRLASRMVPFRAGYVTPLHKLFSSGQQLPIVEMVERELIFTFEVCAYAPKAYHLRDMRDIILEEAEIVAKIKVKTNPDQEGKTGSIDVSETTSG